MPHVVVELSVNPHSERAQGVSLGRAVAIGARELLIQGTGNQVWHPTARHLSVTGALSGYPKHLLRLVLASKAILFSKVVFRNARRYPYF